MAGAATFLLFHAITYVRFRRLMLADAVALGQEGRIRIIASPRATGPLAFGVLHPHVALPLDFDTRFDADERAMAMAHERAHHQRGDLFANMIAMAIMALHWCNPIAWAAWRAYRADQELACDARVLAHHGQDKAHIYGRAIVKAAGGRPFAAARFATACHLTRLDTLKGRLKMLSSHADSLHRISWGMAAVALVTLAGLALTASGSRAAREMAAITGTVDDVNMARLTNLMADAPPREAVQPEPAAPSEPVAMVHAERMVPTPPTAPTPPIAPTADMVAPIPPAPPAPPVAVRHQSNRVTVTRANGWTETHSIPTEADIARMVPVVDVSDGCDSNGKASRQESVNADGRRVIRVRICQAEIDRASRTADRASAQADRMSHDADRASAEADRASRLADKESARADRAANVAALKGLHSARAQIASNPSMPAFARAQALRDIDSEIANMRAGNE